jgi:hypothetical protein
MKIFMATSGASDFSGYTGVLPVQHLVPGALGDGTGCRDVGLGGPQFAQRGAQMADNAVEMPVVQPRQPGVHGAEIGAGIAVRAAKDHGKESGLFSDLPVTIGVAEIRRECRIRADFTAEQLGRGIDGRSAA